MKKEFKSIHHFAYLPPPILNIMPHFSTGKGFLQINWPWAPGHEEPELGKRESDYFKTSAGKTNFLPLEKVAFKQLREIH